MAIKQQNQKIPNNKQIKIIYKQQTDRRNRNNGYKERSC